MYTMATIAETKTLLRLAEEYYEVGMIKTKKTLCRLRKKLFKNDFYGYRYLLFNSVNMGATLKR